MKQLKDIPNQKGYILIGITKDGKQIECIVERDEKTGLHYIVEKQTGMRCYDKLAGWQKANAYLP
jgi:hypothetical protein